MLQKKSSHEYAKEKPERNYFRKKKNLKRKRNEIGSLYCNTPVFKANSIKLFANISSHVTFRFTRTVRLSCGHESPHMRFNMKKEKYMKSHSFLVFFELVVISRVNHLHCFGQLRQVGVGTYFHDYVVDMLIKLIKSIFDYCYRNLILLWPITTSWTRYSFPCLCCRYAIKLTKSIFNYCYRNLIFTQSILHKVK